MKLNLILMLLAAGLGAAAQNGPKISAKVPFAFSSKGTAMPAGVYQVIRSDRGNAMTIRNRQTGKAMVVNATAERGKRASGSWLEFQRHWEKFYLTAVAYKGGGVALEAGDSKRGMAAAETLLAKAE